VFSVIAISAGYAAIICIKLEFSFQNLEFIFTEVLLYRHPYGAGIPAFSICRYQSYNLLIISYLLSPPLILKISVLTEIFKHYYRERSELRFAPDSRRETAV
jgi:hypothetical protein